MREPTRQQIKEAFNKTIERWEGIMEDPKYFNRTNCKLCTLDNDKGDETYHCNNSCPIKDYGDANHSGCAETPYIAFFKDKTSANALAMLNFLRKVYIWWMEEKEKDKKWEGLTGYVKEEKKKEEWVDVTEETQWKISGGAGRYWLIGYCREPHSRYDAQFILDGKGIRLNHSDFSIEYKIEKIDTDFCILRKS